MSSRYGQFERELGIERARHVLEGSLHGGIEKLGRSAAG